MGSITSPLLECTPLFFTVGYVEQYPITVPEAYALAQQLTIYGGDIADPRSSIIVIWPNVKLARHGDLPQREELRAIAYYGKKYWLCNDFSLKHGLGLTDPPFSSARIKMVVWEPNQYSSAHPYSQPDMTI